MVARTRPAAVATEQENKNAIDNLRLTPVMSPTPKTADRKVSFAVGGNAPSEVFETPRSEFSEDTRARLEAEDQEMGPRFLSSDYVFIGILGVIGFVSIVGALALIGAVIPAIDGVSDHDFNPTDSDTAETSFQMPGGALLTAMLAGCLALLVMSVLGVCVLARPMGNKRMIRIAVAIQEGASHFLLIEYTCLTVYVCVVFFVVAFLIGISDPDNEDEWALGFKTACCFVLGSIVSAATGYLGMSIATRANVRTAHAARSGLNPALRVSFNAGSVMGLSVTGSGLFSVAALYYAFQDMNVLAGFGFGASSIALFARVGGGIYTKAADVGADLVGKYEENIPEDDPRNPAVIADNVGDNVGDVAGMGADLFESYVGSLIAAASLGGEHYGNKGVALPFYLASAGIISSIIGMAFVRTTNNAGQTLLLWAIRFGILVASVLFVALAAVVVFVLEMGWQFYIIVLLGLISGVAIGFLTELATSKAYEPVHSIARAGVTGPATVFIRGLAVGMYSTAGPVIVLVGAICGSIYLADDKRSGTGPYGVAIAAVSMLSTLGVTLATDAYGPVADNAGGIAEMAELPHEVRDRTDELDALGNTTAATGKGFAIGSAVLTALALLAAFTTRIKRSNNLTSFTIGVLDDKLVIPGVLIGSVMPYIFGAMTMDAVGKAAMSIIQEVRRQFRVIPGLREGHFGVKADYARCVRVSTFASIKYMVAPGLIAVVVPLIVGLGMGAKALGGLLIGAIVSGFLLAVTMANAGGAWDNAKKYIEAGEMYDSSAVTLVGKMKGKPVKVTKGTEIHKAAVVGDTVGDPFKDTSGPALNILIKLMTIVSLVIAPVFSESR